MQYKTLPFSAIRTFFTIYMFSVRNPTMDLLSKIFRCSSYVPPYQSRCKLGAKSVKIPL